MPQGDGFAPWIEELYNRNITGGCQAAPLLYCPGNPSTRGQMAVFLVKTFGLQLYGPQREGVQVPLLSHRADWTEADPAARSRRSGRDR